MVRLIAISSLVQASKTTDGLVVWCRDVTRVPCLIVSRRFGLPVPPMLLSTGKA